MVPAGFEPTIPASERPQNHALDRAANGIWVLFKESENMQMFLFTLNIRTHTSNNEDSKLKYQTNKIFYLKSYLKSQWLNHLH
jgi:hypothetical protein